jgi:hypothetical protein
MQDKSVVEILASEQPVNTKTEIKTSDVRAFLPVASSALPEEK